MLFAFFGKGLTPLAVRNEREINPSSKWSEPPPETLRVSTSPQGGGLTFYLGPIMSSGRTMASNSSAVTRPVFSASSFSVVPFLCAVLAILAAAS